MSAENQLVEVPAKETALQVYSAANGLDPFLAKIREEIDGFVPDVSTRKGRDAIASIAYKVARSKTALDNVGKELVAELKEVPKKIDAERKRMRDLLDSWQAEVRSPLTEWEEAEAARVARHQGEIDKINLRLECRDLDSNELKANIAWLEGLAISEAWEEFEAEAARAKDKALIALREALVAREKFEAEQAELERLRAEAAAREQKEREERIAREAAEAERLAAERRARKNAKPPLAAKPRQRLPPSAGNWNCDSLPRRRSARSWKHSNAPSRLSVMHSGAPKKPLPQSANGRQTSKPGSSARQQPEKPTRPTRKPSTTKPWRP